MIRRDGPGLGRSSLGVVYGATRQARLLGRARVWRFLVLGGKLMRRPFGLRLRRDCGQPGRAAASAWGGECVLRILAYDAGAGFRSGAALGVLQGGAFARVLAMRSPDGNCPA